jgi:hypothetical protein
MRSLLVGAIVILIVGLWRMMQPQSRTERMWRVGSRFLRNVRFASMWNLSSRYMAGIGRRLVRRMARLG